MKETIKNILLVGMAGLIIYLLFFKPKDKIDYSYYEKAQQDLTVKVDSINTKLDSLGKAKDIIKEHYTTIIKEVEIKKDEIKNNNNLDSLIGLFNKRIFPDYKSGFK